MRRILMISLLIIITCLVIYFCTITEGQENMNEVIPVPDTKEDTDAIKYDPTNLEVDYVQEDENINGQPANVAWVKDADGNMVELKQESDEDTANRLSDNIKYYETGTYKYGSSSYVPTYQDSIYLSKTTGKTTIADFVDETSISKGICNHYKDRPEKLEEECGKLNSNLCASTDCCVLFGGSKCVAGNAQGPTSNLNYGDITIRNRDYYYYKGKCYGNCVEKPKSTNISTNETNMVSEDTGKLQPKLVPVGQDLATTPVLN